MNATISSPGKVFVVDDEVLMRISARREAGSYARPDAVRWQRSSYESDLNALQKPHSSGHCQKLNSNDSLRIFYPSL